jgi:hypothetical protein
LLYGLDIYLYLFSDSVSKILYQPLIVIFFLLGLLVTIGSMFLLPSIKTYKKDGQIIITDSMISISDHTYFLTELITIEINAGDFTGKGTRGGLSDGSGNRIMIVTKDQGVIKIKFVVNSKNQKEKLTQIMKHWKSGGFRIISNGIDLI